MQGKDFFFSRGLCPRFPDWSDAGITPAICQSVVTLNVFFDERTCPSGGCLAQLSDGTGLVETAKGESTVPELHNVLSA